MSGHAYSGQWARYGEETEACICTCGAEYRAGGLFEHRADVIRGHSPSAAPEPPKRDEPVAYIERTPGAVFPWRAFVLYGYGQRRETGTLTKAGAIRAARRLHREAIEDMAEPERIEVARGWGA